MRFLVLGAGGTGGYFGGRLAQGGADVTFLVRPARAALLAETGLMLKSSYGDAQFPIRTVTADTLDGTYDVVILSCKAYDLDNAIAAIRPAMGPDSVVLPLLNGLNHYPALDAAFGAGRVLGGLCHVVATLGPKGEIIQQGPFNRLTFGERQGGISPRVQAIGDALAPGRFELRVSEVVQQETWEKFTFLAAAAGLTSLMRASLGDIARTDDGMGIAREFYGECCAVAAAAGHIPRPDVVTATLALLTDRDSTMTASLMRDIEAGHRDEGDHILGDLYRQSRALGLLAPLLRAAVCHVQAHANRLTREK